MRSLLVFLFVTGCLPDDDRNVCEQAGLLLHRCGVSMPLLVDGPCVGARIGTAECVLDHASDCRGVSQLHQHVEECLLDWGDGLEVTFEGTIGDGGGGLGGAEPTWEDTDAACSDGLDNDQDGFVDCADADCFAGVGVSVCAADTGV